ncbi:hypothetical protein FA13DRAFT_1737895 [Coprinellus micaceus]|uniref:Uncharacterized protein n=1 Tax=Coprinellus micaceus TaxID=71717 RepID=A0A4Y7SVV5_COPMI|nr:hypothetical protein FA13DRAFT_1737895 [Coprinellus micaceus]
MKGPRSLVLYAGLIGCVSAQTVSLYLPLFDPQPLTADVAGVGADSQTTWLIRASAGDGFRGTATLVQGPTGASFTFSSPEPTGITLSYQCAFEGGNAVCSGVDEDGTAVTATDSIELLAVTLGTTVPGAQVTSAPAGTTGSTTTTSSSGPGSDSSSTSTSTAATGSPSNGGAMQKTLPLSVTLLLFISASTFLLA